MCPDVRLHGRVADVECLRDLGVRHSAGEVSEHLKLAVAQLFEPRWHRRPWGRAAEELLDHASGDGPREQ
jgi:hypothetical protein